MPLTRKAHVDTAAVEYRDIECFPGYRVGVDGSVWSCWKTRALPSGRGSESYTSDEWRRLQPAMRKSGHFHVTLCGSGRRLNRDVHRLVLEAFVGPCPEGMEACHNDGNPANNRRDNLRWGTPKDNAADRDRHGRTYCGERHHRAKLTGEAVAIIRQRLRNGEAQRLIAKDVGVAQGVISAINRNKIWKRVA